MCQTNRPYQDPASTNSLETSKHKLQNLKMFLNQKPGDNIIDRILGEVSSMILKFANGAASAAMVHLLNLEDIFQKLWRAAKALAHIHEETNPLSITNAGRALGSAKDKALVAAVFVDKTTFNGTFTEPHTATLGLSGGGSLGPGYRQDQGLYFSYDLFNLNVEVGRYQTDSILIGWEAGAGGSVGFFNTFDISGTTTSLNGSIGPSGMSVISSGHFTEGFNYTGSQFSLEFSAPAGLSGAGQETRTTPWLSF